MTAWNLHERRHDLLAMFAGRPASTLAGHTTGFAGLDKVIFGLRGVTVLGGHNYAGKSILATGIALHVVEHASEPTPALIVSGEMSRDQTMSMIAGAAIGVEPQAILAGRLGKDKREQFKEYIDRVGKHIHVMTQFEGVSRAAIEEALASKEKGIVVFDSLQVLARGWFPQCEEKKQIDRAMVRLCRWQEETRAAFLVISQLPKVGAVGFNFSGSGSIDYATDSSWVLEKLEARRHGKATHRLRVVKVRCSVVPHPLFRGPCLHETGVA